MKRPNRTNSLDKTSTELYAYLTVVQIEIGDISSARESLRRAKNLADRFDQAPDYDADSIRFVAAGRPATAFDDMGDTAEECILSLIEAYKSDTLMKLWKEVTTDR